MEFTKETKDHILDEKNYLDSQIKNLIACVEAIANERSITVSYELHLTLIDGKVLNILTATKSCQLCSICGVGLKQFMETLNMKAFKPKPENLQYGLSPLRGWKRIFAFV